MQPRFKKHRKSQDQCKVQNFIDLSFVVQNITCDCDDFVTLAYLK